MFSKILIANRGEIACRVIKTARRMGIATVAVYSEADRDAVHVEMADEAVLIGPPAAAQSYLDIGKIIEAARQTGADAVHPGYGFLSENAGFARALEEAGIAFIGPPVPAIEAMGDKIESKKFAAKAKVSTVPGHLGVIEDAEHAIRISGSIGYPVMIKASAGGGGKGMRIAWSQDDVRSGFEASRAEAKSSFGDDRIFIEKFIEEPRHIEIQVLGDQHGNIVYLGERECSIQRRNQKVLEEAPSPFVDEALRREMGEQAVALARAVGYFSAGTVEFITDARRNFYFLEMNTRLQVEHPVTELATGLDLVELMIRVGAGEKLPIKQEDVHLKGWAIEARIYAEDPLRGFLPSTGRLVRYRPPAEGTEKGLTTRNDTGVEEGGEISIYYDPMIAKLVTHAPTRIAAIDHMSRALDSFAIDGIRHNIPFLAALMQHPRWREGNLSTRFIDDEYPDGFSPRVAVGEERETLVAIAAVIDHMSNMRRREISDQMPGDPVRFSAMRSIEYAGVRDTLLVDSVDANLFEVTLLDDARAPVRLMRLTSDWWFGDPVWEGRIDGVPTAVQVRPILNGYTLAFHGIEGHAYVYTPREAQLADLMPVKVPPDTSKLLRCPMPGLVVAIHVGEGDDIRAGDPLCIVEAMKMQNILRAERDTKVVKLNAKPGDSLAVDAVIMEFA